jgi:hypothetical protein
MLDNLGRKTAKYFWREILWATLSIQIVVFLYLWSYFSLNVVFEEWINLLIEIFFTIICEFRIKVENLANMLDNLGGKTAMYFWQ